MKKVLASILLLVTLAGCAPLSFVGGKSSNTESEASSPPTDPSALVGLWRVSGVATEGVDTFLRLGPELVVWSKCGVTFGSWVARGSAFLADASEFDSADCVTGDLGETIPWLAQASSFSETADGIALLKADGSVVATLTIDGLPPKSSSYNDRYRDQPTSAMYVDDELELPQGVSAPGDITGRWVDPNSPNDEAFIEFASDGFWSGSDGCNGVSGRWAIGQDGAFLMTSGPTTLVGCTRSDASSQVLSSALVGATDQGLTFYDSQGRPVQHLVAG